MKSDFSPIPLAKVHKRIQTTITLYKKSAKFYVILAENHSKRCFSSNFCVILRLLSFKSANNKQ